MSTEIIVGIVGLALFLLVTIALTMQTIEKNRKEKKRQLGLLYSRVRNFEYMLNGFPEGFLGNDLQVLVCKSLQEVFQQLRKISPQDKSYPVKLAELNTKIDQISQQSNSSNKVTLTDKAQITEVQKLLKGLFNFISQLSASKRISSTGAQQYAGQIRRLMLQTTTDSLNNAIAAAIKAGKFPLALHNLKMAVDKLEKENGKGEYTAQINQYKAQIQQLDSKTEEKKAEDAKRKASLDSEWDELDKDDQKWKKKALYD